jgi:hypothetical protein
MFFFQVDLELNLQALLACPIGIIAQKSILGFMAKFGL